MSIFDLKNVTFKYSDSNKVVLEDITLEINNGEFLCVLGKSGCGKSTLLKLFAGLLFPTEGKISFRGEEIKKASIERGVVFQDYGLFPWMSAGNNLMLALRQKYDDVEKAKLKDIAYEYLRKVGLDISTYNMLPKQLSGGMKQRVAIAQALCVNPDVLLMDEPFGALDAVTRAKLQDMVKDLLTKSEIKKTVVFITHDVDEALLLADRIIVLGQSPSKVIFDKTLDKDEKMVRGSAEPNPKMMSLRNDLINVINKDVNSYI